MFVGLYGFVVTNVLQSRHWLVESNWLVSSCFLIKSFGFTFPSCLSCLLFHFSSLITKGHVSSELMYSQTQFQPANAIVPSP
jgi:hypothetical protein